MDRAEFVKLLANVQLLKERLASADQQIGLYKKLDSDQKRLIVLHSERIKELENYVSSTDGLTGGFKEAIEQTELVLDESDRRLRYEKRLSRYKNYAFIAGGVIVWLMW